MPFVTETAPGGLALQQDQAPQIDRSPDFFSETLPAAFDIGNTGKNFSDWVGRKWHDSIRTPYTEPDDPTFDPFAHIAGYEQYPDAFIEARNIADVWKAKERIDRELNQKQTLADAGGAGIVAMLGAGVLDPVNLIPAGRVAESGNILRGIFDGAKLGLLSGVASEPIMQANQLTRDWREGMFDIGASTILTGALGGGFAALKALRGGDVDALTKLTAEIEGDMTYPAGRDPMAPGFLEQSEAALLYDTDPEIFGGSVGAASARDTTLAQETLKSAFGVEKVAAFTTPMLRGATSPAVVVRRVMQELAETPLRYAKNALGIASPTAVETRIKGWDANLDRGLKAMDQSFVQYRTGKSEMSFGDLTKIAGVDLVRAQKTHLTYAAFKEEIGKAMRRGDEHDIPEVAAAARALRREIFDPLKNYAIEHGLLSEGVEVTTAPSYLTRVWNQGKIAARRTEFESRIAQWLKEQQGTAAERAEELAGRLPQLESRVAELEQRLTELKGGTAPVGGEVIRKGKVRESKAEFKARRDEQTKAARDVVAARREYQNAARAHAAALSRLEALKPDAAAKDNPLREVVQKLKRGVKEPGTLSDWVKSKGGLKDESGDVAVIAGGTGGKGVEKLVNNKSGMTLDDAARAAWEEGFFKQDERPTVNQFLDALDGDVKEYAPVHRASDEAAAAEADQLRDWQAFFDQNGVDVRKMSEDEIIKRVESGQFGEMEFREPTAANRARSKETALFEDRAFQRKTKSEQAMRAAEVKAAETKAALDLARNRAAQAANDLSSTTAAHSKTLRHLEQTRSKLETERGMLVADDGELMDAARQITDHLISGQPGRIPYDAVPIVRGPLKERTLDIPDRRIEDFLESDVEHIARVYKRTMAADTELARTFGTADLRGQMDDIREHYAQLRKNAKGEKALKALDKRMNDDLRDVAAVRDRLRGTYGMPQDPRGLAYRFVRVVKDLNYLRLMGGMTLAAIPDLGRAVMIHGISRTAQDGLRPLVKNWKAFKLAAGEVKLAGTALDMSLDSRAMGLADVFDDYGRLTRFERGLKAVTSRYGLVALMSPWNAALKQFAGVITQTGILRAVRDGATKAQSERLAMLGIDVNMAARIARQFKEYGEDIDGTLWANTAAWRDREATEAFRGALVKEVDTTIVTPGVADRPLWMSSPLGQVIGQFKSFSFASTQRVAIAGLQQRDAAVLNGVLLSTALGMLSYAIKTDPDHRSDDPARWIGEGLDRSGVLGIFSDAVNMGSRTLGIGWSGSRYAARGSAEMFLGPSIGLVNDALTLAQFGGDGQVRGSQVKAFRRLLPYQNLFYLRGLFDKAEENAISSLGAQ